MPPIPGKEEMGGRLFMWGRAVSVEQRMEPGPLGSDRSGRSDTSKLSDSGNYLGLFRTVRNQRECQQ